MEGKRRKKKINRTKMRRKIITKTGEQRSNKKRKLMKRKEGRPERNWKEQRREVQKRRAH